MIQIKSKPYSVETLQPLNAAYDAEHCLTQADVDRVNALVMHIGNTRSAQVRKPGIGSSIHPVPEIIRKMPASTV